MLKSVGPGHAKSGRMDGLTDIQTLTQNIDSYVEFITNGLDKKWPLYLTAPDIKTSL